MSVNLGVNPTEVVSGISGTDDSGTVKVGTIGYVGAKEYVYLQANGDITLGDLVGVANAGQARSVSTPRADKTSSLAIALADVKNDEYAWFQTVGDCEVRVIQDAISVGEQLFTHATDVGVVRKSGGGAGKRISGLTLTKSRIASGGTLTLSAFLFHPYIDRV